MLCSGPPKNRRGNIILASLFIAIFLFFLSVALIWTNRQDIALSLSMEHKLKAQSAARSGAYEAYARLREFGELGSYRGGTLPGGAEVQVELVGLQPFGKRGEVLQVRARGKSGPVSSYLTLHLQDSRLTGEENRKDKRVFFFPGDEPGGEPGEESSSAETQEVAPQPSRALYGDFVLREGGLGVVQGMQAGGGPAFFKRALPPSTYPPSFQDFVPIYSPDLMSLSGWGRVFVVAPPYPQLSGSEPTELRHLIYDGTDFDFEEIDPPDDLGDPEPDPSNMQGAFLMEAPPNNTWTTASVYGVGPDNIRTRVWTAKKPPTSNAGELLEGEPFVSEEAQQAGPTVDWSSVARIKPQQKFATRGEIYAQEKTVYSHGWHYVYQQHRGSVPSTVTPIDGAILTRWPCILKYTINGQWEKVWTPLKDDGAVQTEHRPDPRVLLATKQDKIFSVTEPQEGKQRRLLTLTGKTAKVGEPVPSGRLVLYKDEPYLVPSEPTKPGLVNLLSGELIDFSSLPDSLPEIFGEVIDVTGTEMMVLGIEGGYSGEVLDSTKRLSYTARPRYNFTYDIRPGGQIAVDGDDLWAVIQVDVEMLEPTFPQAYKTPPFSGGSREVLARYDGQRWHILPNGLRACLYNGLASPGRNVISAVYPGLPEQMNRYSVVSIDTNPFKMNQLGQANL